MWSWKRMKPVCVFSSYHMGAAYSRKFKNNYFARPHPLTPPPPSLSQSQTLCLLSLAATKSQPLFCTWKPRIWGLEAVVEEENKPCTALNSCGGKREARMPSPRLNVFTAVRRLWLVVSVFLKNKDFFFFKALFLMKINHLNSSVGWSSSHLWEEESVVAMAFLENLEMVNIPVFAYLRSFC